MPDSYWIETLGCPKNQVDSDKIAGYLTTGGMLAAQTAKDADLVVVNTCAFVESAREESIETILELSESGPAKQQMVVTGCMAERYGTQLAEALPEVGEVIGFGTGFGVPVHLSRRPPSKSQAKDLPQMDLLNMSRPRSELPWAYVKIAEGCDRNCGYCAIPQFRGPQRSRSIDSICGEIVGLEIKEAVLVAQDLASFGRDTGKKQILQLLAEASQLVDWVRLLYLYPADLTDELIDTICSDGVAYFDLSLQHVSRPLLRRMRRWGDKKRFLSRIHQIRALHPQAAFRSNFIVGYPGETEVDHEQLLSFIEEAQLDWCAFFPFSPEEDTYAITLDEQVDSNLIKYRLAELQTLQEEITQARRQSMVGRRLKVLVDEPEVARSYMEAPEIDGIVHVPGSCPVGEFVEVEITEAVGTDLVAVPVNTAAPSVFEK